MKTAIVLSGGGAKGAYQIGFWKAIRELGIKYDIVTGTSIGALNGAFMVQGNYNDALRLWHGISYNKVLEGTLDSSYYDSKERLDVIKKYVKGVSKGGLDIPGLEKLLEDNLRYDLFYNSSVDYGLVTVKYPSLKPVMLTKNKIAKEKLKDYLIASASCFPAFKTRKIDNESYIDGGYYDNMPVDLAIKMGADNIICVDLSAPGKIRKRNYDNINITMIKSKNYIGNFLALEKEQTRKSMKLGYNDTMKVFKELEGDFYTFKKGSLNRNFRRINNRFYDNLELYIETVKDNIKFKKLYSIEKKVHFNKILEDIMKAFSIDDEEIYRTSYVNVLIKRAYKTRIKQSENRIKNILKNEKINKNLVNKEIICYIYEEILKNSKKVDNLATIFPSSFLCAIYLKTILKK